MCVSAVSYTHLDVYKRQTYRPNIKNVIKCLYRRILNVLCMMAQYFIDVDVESKNK